MPKRQRQTLPSSTDDSSDEDVLDGGFHCHCRCLQNDRIIDVTNLALTGEGHRYSHRS